MSTQNSVLVRDNRLDSFETTVGVSPKLRIYTGAPPADCATAASGSLLVEIPLPVDWLQAAGSGQKVKNGTWSATASGSGTAGYYRIYDNAGTTAHEQGNVFQGPVIPTSALTAANGNVLAFASTTGVSLGMTVTGAGVPSGSIVVALTGTTVTLSKTSTAGVASAVGITFGGELTLDNTSIAAPQLVTVTAYTKSAGNA